VGVGKGQVCISRVFQSLAGFTGLGARMLSLADCLLGVITGFGFAYQFGFVYHGLVISLHSAAAAYGMGGEISESFVSFQIRA